MTIGLGTATSADVDNPRVARSYEELSQAFPLRPIQTVEGLAAARAALRSLTGIERTRDEDDYFLVLCGIIQAYEREHVALPTVTPGDILRAMMEDREVSQAELAQATGIASSNISAMLNNHRGISKRCRAIFAEFFGVASTRFLVD